MDPNVNLEEQLEISRSIINEDIDKHTSSETAWMAGQGQRLAELVLSLDEWLAGGCFKPRRWNDGDR